MSYFPVKNNYINLYNSLIISVYILNKIIYII